MSDTSPLGPYGWALLTMASVSFRFHLSLRGLMGSSSQRHRYSLCGGTHPGLFLLALLSLILCFPLFNLCLLLFRFNLGAALIFCIS